MRKKYPRQQPKPHVNTYLQQAEAEEGIEVDDEPSRPRMRFGMRGLLMLMLVASVTFAGGGYLLHAVKAGAQSRTRLQLSLILFTLVAPIAFLIVFSVVSWILRLAGLQRASEESPDDDS